MRFTHILHLNKCHSQVGPPHQSIRQNTRHGFEASVGSPVLDSDSLPLWRVFAFDLLGEEGRLDATALGRHRSLTRDHTGSSEGRASLVLASYSVDGGSLGSEESEGSTKI